MADNYHQMDTGLDTVDDEPGSTIGRKRRAPDFQDEPESHNKTSKTSENAHPRIEEIRRELESVTKHAQEKTLLLQTAQKEMSEKDEKLKKLLDEKQGIAAQLEEKEQTIKRHADEVKRINIDKAQTIMEMNKKIQQERAGWNHPSL
ncbi:hypothetical protein V5O48_014141, partial [Marasmius crinis-equi]